MALSKEQLLFKLNDLKNQVNRIWAKARAESLLLEYINDPEIDEKYTEIRLS